MTTDSISRAAAVLAIEAFNPRLEYGSANGAFMKEGILEVLKSVPSVEPATIVAADEMRPLIFDPEHYPEDAASVRDFSKGYNEALDTAIRLAKEARHRNWLGETIHANAEVRLRFQYSRQTADDIIKALESARHCATTPEGNTDAK